MSAVDPHERDTITEVLRLAGRSPAAARLASDALRAAALRSPVVGHRVRRAVETALGDRSVRWTDEERAILADALVVARPRDAAEAEMDAAVRERLSQLIQRTADPRTGKPLALTAWAVLLGCNIRTLRRWLGAELPIGGPVSQTLAAIESVDVGADDIVVRYRRT